MGLTILITFQNLRFINCDFVRIAPDNNSLLFYAISLYFSFACLCGNALLLFGILTIAYN